MFLDATPPLFSSLWSTWLRPWVLHCQSLCVAKCLSENNAACFCSEIQERSNKWFVVQSLGWNNQRENGMKKTWTSRANFVNNSLFSSTSPSLSLRGTYLRRLLSTTVVRTCEENVPSNSSPATATLVALATHHPSPGNYLIFCQHLSSC